MILMRLVPKEAREAYRWDGLAGLLVGFYSGLTMPFVAFLARDQLHASALQISLLSASPFVGHLFSLFWANHMQGREKIPYVVYIGVLTRGMIGLVFLATSPTVFVGIVSAAFAISAFSLPAYATVMKDIYPDAHRGRCMGLVRMGVVFTNIGGAALGGRLLAEFSYRLVFPAAAVFGMLSSFSFFRLRSVVRATEDAAAPRVGLLDSLAIMRRDRLFRYYSIAFFTFGFGNLMNNPLFPLFQVDVLHINSYWVSALTIVQSVLGGIAYYLWGRMIDRRSPFAAVLASFGLFSVVPLTYYFTHSLPTLFVASLAAGIAGPGVELTWLNAVMQFADREGVARYSALHFTLVGIRGLLAPLATVALLHYLDLRQVFLVCFAVVLLGTVMMAAVVMRRQQLGATVPTKDNAPCECS